jgi:hypothetical protein
MSAVLLSGSILTLFCVSDSGCDASVVLICCQLTTSLAWRPQLGGLRFTVHVPDEVDFKLEIEIGEDERELEVEITWRSRPMPLTRKRLMASCARVRIEVLGFLPTPCAMSRKFSAENGPTRFRRGDPD